jgi:hypothetical protein
MLEKKREAHTHKSTRVLLNELEENDDAKANQCNAIQSRQAVTTQFVCFFMKLALILFLFVQFRQWERERGGVSVSQLVSR